MTMIACSLSEKTKWRCTKGHEWERDRWQNAVDSFSITLSDGSTSGPICMRCISEFLQANMGKVESVVDDGVDKPIIVEQGRL